MKIPREMRVWPAFVLMVAVAMACGSDQTSSEEIATSSSRVLAESADSSVEGGLADAATEPDSDDARLALAQERARCTSATTHSAVLPGEADGFTRDGKLWLNPLLPSDAVDRTRHKAVVRIPGSLDAATELQEQTANTAVGISLVGAAAVTAETADGYVVYRDAKGSGAHVLRRPSAEGFEDFFVLPKAPAAPQIDYHISLDGGVAGVRLLNDTLELLDAGGIPRLRLNPPAIQGSDCAFVPAHLALTGCESDSSPRVPWGRPVTPPVNTTCTLSVSWDEASVTYPALVDPSWVTPGNMSLGRSEFSLTALSNGNALAAGGRIPTINHPTNGVEVLNVSTGTWAATGNMNFGRKDHAAVLLTSGKVLIGGGNSTFLGSANSAETWDPSTGIWTSTANTMSVNRSAPSMVKLGDGTVLAPGGDSYSTSVDVYTPATNSWTAKASLNVGREGASVLLPGGSAGKVLVIGGDATSASCEIFTPAGTGAGSWSTTTALPSPRDYFGWSQFANGDVLVSGGVLLSTGAASTATHLFSASAGTWTAKGNLSTARGSHTSILLPSQDGAVLVAGGNNGSTTAFASAEVFNLGSGAWSTHTAMVSQRQYHSVAMPQSGYVLELGGQASTGNPLATGELMDPCNGVTTDDGNSCTTDTCDAKTGAVTHSVAAAVGAFCNGGNFCNPKTCTASGTCQTGTAPLVDDGNACTTDTCDPLAGPKHTPASTGTACIDGRSCNSTCDGQGACAPNTALNDNNACTIDTSDPSSHAFVRTPQPAGSPCPDSNVCNGTEVCNAAGACLVSSGTP